MTYTVSTTGWPAGWYDAAVANMQTVVNEYNAYGDFTQGNSGNIYVYYDAGIPTAQSGYGGWGGSIGVGGTYPNVRVLLHESSHWLGTGTYSAYWSGPHAAALIQQFDGVGAVLSGDSQHYWPYGENYDSESSPINDLRHVAMVYALRQDFGLVSVDPSSWAATSVSLTASDALGESGFNYTTKWSDNTFAHANADYSTGNFLLRTPAASASFTFAGNSVTVNNTNGISGGLLYKGSATTGVVTFKSLNLNGGYVRHASSSADLFQLAGPISATGTSTIDAAQGNIKILGNIGGSGSLVFGGAFSTTLVGSDSYTGTTTINGTTLALGGNDRIADTSNLNLNGGTFATSGFSETLGALSLSANSTIDLGGGMSTLRFSGPGAFAAGTTLAITNWTAGSDRLFIGNSASLTPAQLGQITLNGAPAFQLSTGEIVAALSAAPTVSSPASANPNPVTTAATNLSVLGSDDGGEAGLVYTWSSSGPAPVTFSDNATNSAKNTTASFSAPGAYTFTATITDPGGMSTTSTTAVTVNAAPAAITLSPLAPTLGINTTQQFVASVTDQFGAAINSASVTWSVPVGGGTISSTGLYTAPASPGNATIRASSGNVSTTAAVSVVPVSEEIAWYKADETSGNYLADSSGHDRPGTVTGNYAFTAGETGNALSLSGGYASLPGGILSSTTSFTISAWVNLSSLSTWSRIFDFGTGTTVNMFLTPQADTNLPRFAITTSGGGSEQRIDSNTAIAPNTWTHVAVTLSGTTGTLYINGNVVGTNTAMTLNPASLGNTTNNYIGKSEYNDPALQGSIDDFRIYGRALSASEIQSLAAGNAAPTVATSASASASPVTGTSTGLSVLGADDAGEGNLTYTWSATGPAAVTYAANGTNAAKTTTATFAAAGSYLFTATIRDAGGLTTTSSVSVTVNQTLTTVAVSPASVTVNANGSQQFAATAKDQFGAALATQPTFAWSVASGGGTITSAGLYTAPSAAGSATVQAAAGGVSGTASVTVTAPQPPAAPGSLTAAKSGRNKAKLTWTDNSTNETGFHVWSSRDGVTWTLVSSVAAAAGTGTSVSYTTGALSTGTWYFKVTSYDADGDSAGSNVVSLVI